MSGIIGIPFGLSFAGFEFGAVEVILLVVAAATALVSLVEIIRLSSRDHLQQRVAELRGAIVERTGVVRFAPAPWYDQLGAILAKSPLVGGAEQTRLAAKLALAGIVGRGRGVATFIAIRFLFAVLGAAAAWLGIHSVELQPDLEGLRYAALAVGLVVGWRLPDIVLNILVRRRKVRLEIGFPDALDLLVICAEAGLGLEQAMGQVAHDLRHATPEVAAEFAIAAAEMRILADRRLALENLAARTGPRDPAWHDLDPQPVDQVWDAIVGSAASADRGGADGAHHAPGGARRPVVGHPAPAGDDLHPAMSVPGDRRADCASGDGHLRKPLCRAVRRICMTMPRPANSPAILGLLALLLGGCDLLGALDGQPPSVNLDRAAVARVAAAAQNSGEYATAAGVYEKYVDSHPGDAVAQASFGEAALQAGEMDKAAEIFAKALELAPDRVDARMGLGRIYLAKQKPNQALAEFQAVIASDPKSLRALNGAGIALDLLGRSHDAQQSYRAALAIKPDDRAARNNLGLSLALSGAYDQAIAELSKLALEPGATARMRQNLALALGLKGDEAGMARVAQADLDAEAIAENQRFFATMRRLGKPSEGASGGRPAAADKRTGS